ncbi:hypothetical protein [Acidiphilium sp.]|uniref:hypothetical protein n=1 Tax=Acidiphilium sp. TaxID=527 RepID=UPI003D01F233
MYSQYRHIFIPTPQATPVPPISGGEVGRAKCPAPERGVRWRGIASGLLAALPFMVSLLMIGGFGLAIYPLVVHGLPLFLHQSALALNLHLATGTVA